MADDRLQQLIEDTLTYSEKAEAELKIEDYRSLRRALHTDILDVIAADRSFFVLGSYNDEEKHRLEKTVEHLYNEGHAFLLDDTLEAWKTGQRTSKYTRIEQHTSSACSNTLTAATSGKLDTWIIANIGERCTS